MIIGLLIVGSALGALAFGTTLAIGYSMLIALLAYLGTAAISMVVISCACAFRPRSFAHRPSVPAQTDR